MIYINSKFYKKNLLCQNYITSKQWLCCTTSFSCKMY